MAPTAGSGLGYDDVAVMVGDITHSTIANMVARIRNGTLAPVEIVARKVAWPGCG